MPGVEEHLQNSAQKRQRCGPWRRSAGVCRWARRPSGSPSASAPPEAFPPASMWPHPTATPPQTAQLAPAHTINRPFNSSEHTIPYNADHRDYTTLYTGKPACMPLSKVHTLMLCTADEKQKLVKSRMWCATVPCRRTPSISRRGRQPGRRHGWHGRTA